MKNWYIVQTFSGFEQKVAEVIKDSVKKKNLDELLEQEFMFDYFIKLHNYKKI